MNHHLLDGEEWNAQHPRTFWIPDRAERENIPEGSIVKVCLCFEDDASEVGDDEPGVTAERFWVIVKRRSVRNGGIEYVATVDNKLLFTDGYGLGDTITFGPEHIIDIACPLLRSLCRLLHRDHPSRRV